MNIKTITIIAALWELFFGGIMIWYWNELSLTDRYFIVGGEIILFCVIIFFCIQIYLTRDEL